MDPQPNSREKSLPVPKGIIPIGIFFIYIWDFTS
jgi:hypothetical protein